MVCTQPGASVARMAQSHGLKENMVHAWRRLERLASAARDLSPPVAAAHFIALPLPQASAPGTLPDIRIELRRGATTAPRPEARSLLLRQQLQHP